MAGAGSPAALMTTASGLTAGPPFTLLHARFLAGPYSDWRPVIVTLDTASSVVLGLALGWSLYRHRWQDVLVIVGLLLTLIDALVWLGLALALVGVFYPLYRRYR